MRKKVIRCLLVLASFVLTVSLTSARTCTTLTKSLSKYSENNEVLLLQQFLFDSGYLTVKPNGYFGENTRKALLAFQKNEKIASAGVTNQLTRGKIKEISCGTTSLAKKVSNEDIITNKEVKPIVIVKDTPTAVVAPKEIPTIYVRTLLASNITSDSATLNGIGGVDGEKHWFQWGATMGMDNITPSVIATSYSNYSSTITGLLPNTTYYFRAVTSVGTSTDRKAETAYGDIRYFVTPAAAVVATTPAPTVTISSTGIAVNSSGSAKVTWVSTNTSTCYFTGGEDGGSWTKQTALSGQYITEPITKETTFGIACKNNSQYTVTGSVKVPKIVN